MKVFYDPRQNVDGISSYSASAGKPKRFIETLLNRYPGADIQPVTPVTRDDLLLAHKKSYIDDLFALRISNGFENTDPRVPPSLLWTVGSLTDAMMHAYTEGVITCSPTSGFHHAGYDYGGGFCSVNGLIVAASRLLVERPGARVAVIDLDAHYADGSFHVLEHRPSLAKQILYLSVGAQFYGDESSGEFFSWLQHAIRAINEFKPDVIIYQAGADMSKSDNLKSGLLTDYEMCQRDRMVFHRLRAPMVFNLAGGYQDITDIRDPVIDIHMRTFDIASSAPERIS